MFFFCIDRKTERRKQLSFSREELSIRLLAMAAAALFRSLANKMARAPPTQFQFLRGLHGGAARFGPAAAVASSSPPPPTSCKNQADQFMRGMASASQLRTLATRPHSLVFQRGLSGSTPPTSKMDFSTAHAKGRAAVAYVMLFVSMGYLCSLIPRLDRLASKLEAQKKARLDDDLTQAIEAIEAIELVLAEEDMSTLVPQDAGHGKHPVGATQEGTRYEDLQADITKLRIAFESASSKGKA